MNNLDDLFKNKLEQNGLEFQEEYWNEMEGIIDLENKKKRRFILFFSGLSVVVIGSIMGLLFSDNNKNEKLAVLSSTPTVNIETNASATNNSDNNAIIENKIEQVENKKPNNSESNNQITKPSKRTSISKNQEKAINTYLPQVVSNNSNSANSKPSNNLVENPVNINTLNYGTETDDKDHLVFADFMRFNTSKIELEQVLPHTCKNCAHGLKLDSLKPKVKVNWVYQIGLEALYNFNNRTAINSNITKSNNSLGYLASFSGSKKHWGFKTGLEYYKYQEQNDYPNTRKLYTYDTSYRLINAFYSVTPKGTRIALIGRKIDTTESLNSYYTNTKLGLQYFSIPLHVLYTTSLGKFSLQFEAGINAGFLIRKTGTYANLIQNNYVLKAASSSNEFSPMLNQTYIGLGCSYPIYKQISLQANVSMHNAIGTYLQGSSSKLNRKGFGLGVVYRLK